MATTLAAQVTSDWLLDRISAGPGAPVATFADFEVSSAFQPIFEVAEQELIGYEALFHGRGSGGARIPVNEAFAVARDAGMEPVLDWLSLAVHVAGFQRLAPPSARLFLNFLPATALATEAFGEIMKGLIDHYALDPGRIVLEVLEYSCEDEGRLAETVARTRESGCRIALDDFGAGPTEIERILRIGPDIVKINRPIVRAAARDPRALRLLQGAVQLMQECDAVVVVEGVERRDEAFAALMTSAEWVQGYYFGRPAEGEADAEAASRAFATIAPPLQPIAWAAVSSALVDEAFAATVMALETGVTFHAATELLLNLEGAMRCYLLGVDGRMLGSIWRATDRRSSQRSPGGAYGRVEGHVRRLASRALRDLRVVHAAARDEDPHRHITQSFAFELSGERLVLCLDFAAVAD